MCAGKKANSGVSDIWPVGWVHHDNGYNYLLQIISEYLVFTKNFTIEKLLKKLVAVLTLGGNIE